MRGFLCLIGLVAAARAAAIGIEVDGREPEAAGARVAVAQNGGGRVTLADCHRFDSCAGVPGAARAHVLGGQGNCWSEYTWNLFDLDWKTWPRACALAEALWLGADRPGFDDFLARMRAHRRRLVAAGVNCANVD